MSGPPILSLLTGPIKDTIGAIGGVIDNLHTSDAEKMAAKLELAKIEGEFNLRAAEIAQSFAITQADVIKTEAQSPSWMARNWRPLLMLVFTYIIAHTYILAPLFGLREVIIPERLWDVINIGVGGYVGGRTLEKIAVPVATALRKVGK